MEMKRKRMDLRYLQRTDLQSPLYAVDIDADSTRFVVSCLIRKMLMVGLGKEIEVNSYRIDA